MEKVKTSVRLPADIVEQMDELAQRWYADRTSVIIRIYLEWKEQQAKTTPASDTPEENPVEQMKKNGAAPLVEA